MEISTADVVKLRKATGAGMMDCKNALADAEGNFDRAVEIIREKGTNRSRFFRGQVDKYSWVDVGSSYLPSDILAAFLLARIDGKSPVDYITSERDKAFVRATAKSFLRDGELTLREICARWTQALAAGR